MSSSLEKVYSPCLRFVGPWHDVAKSSCFSLQQHLVSSSNVPLQGISFLRHGRATRDKLETMVTSQFVHVKLLSTRGLERSGEKRVNEGSAVGVCGASEVHLDEFWRER